jgi:histidinol-phosphatase (PHP family)
MKWTNYHSHTNFSDGKGNPELYVQSAFSKGMYAYGFSCHSPVPFLSGWNMKFENLKNYMDEINRLKIKYSDTIKIFKGLEIDYVKDLVGIDQYLKYKLDYTIGAVHFLGFFDDGRVWDFDRGSTWFKKGLEELFDNNKKKLVAYFYKQVIDMTLQYKPTIIAHFDLIKKYNANNSFFEETSDWYREIAFEALEQIAKTDSILEVNTRGVLKNLNNEFYPSNFILRRCKELGVPLCLSADTHHPDDVMALLPEAKNLLEEIGYKEVYLLDENGWSPSPLI